MWTLPQQLLLLSAVAACSGRSTRIEAPVATAAAAPAPSEAQEQRCLDLAEREWERRQSSFERLDAERGLLASPSSTHPARAQASPARKGPDSTAADVAITRRVRRALSERGDLSFAARNVKIVTIDGRVTLRGAVTSARERAAVVEIAGGAAGEENVRSEL